MVISLAKYGELTRKHPGRRIRGEARERSGFVLDLHLQGQRWLRCTVPRTAHGPWPFTNRWHPTQPTPHQGRLVAPVVTSSGSRPDPFGRCRPRYFEDWAATAYRLFQRHRIALWGTFNEPTCAAFTGYIVGIHAPGRRGAVAAAGAVLLHMLRAHTAAYHALKREGGEDVRVGLVHQHIRFEPEGALLIAYTTGKRGRRRGLSQG